MQPDFQTFFSDFYSNAKLARGINSTSVTLVPKIEGASSFNDYRPISMVRSIYKILAKVLANRFRKCHAAYNRRVSGSFYWR